MSQFHWSKNDINSLRDAVTEGRLPGLQHLCIRFGNLGGYGTYLVDIIKRPSMKTVDLTDTHLTQADGSILLRALEVGYLGNLQSLTLLQNPGLSSLVEKLRVACAREHIVLQCTSLPSKFPCDCKSMKHNASHPSAVKGKKYHVTGLIARDEHI